MKLMGTQVEGCCFRTQAPQSACPALPDSSPPYPVSDIRVVHERPGPGHLAGELEHGLYLQILQGIPVKLSLITTLETYASSPYNRGLVYTSDDRAGYLNVHALAGVTAYVAALSAAACQCAWI